MRDMIQKKDDVAELSAGENYSFDDFIGKTFRVVDNTAFYQKDENGAWIDMRDDSEFMSGVVKDGIQLEIVGIIRTKEESMSSISGTIGYTKELMEIVSENVNNSVIVKEQRENEEYDVFTALPFDGTSAADAAKEQAELEAEQRRQEAEEMMANMEQMPSEEFDMSMLPPEQQQALAAMSDEERAAYIASMQIGNAPGTAASQPTDMTAEIDFSKIDLSSLTEEQQMYLASLSDEERQELMAQYMQSAAASDIVSSSTYYDNMKTLGVINLDTPSSISIYPIDFEAKEKITDIIADYNTRMENSGEDGKVITYTDIVGMLMSSVTDIINAISYILIAFVAISLVVSSIMIGIITYISVLERTKEIGILRSIGASKRDISRVFNAETVIIGLVSGGIGIGVTLLLNIVINIIIEDITNIAGLSQLPALAGVALVAISVLLTLIAGLFPSRVAAKKDPVVALRTE